MRAANAAFTAAGSSSGCAGATTSTASAAEANAAKSASSILVRIEHLPVETELDAPVVPRRIEVDRPDRNVGIGQEPVRIATLELDQRDARIGHAELLLRRRDDRGQALEVDRG